MKCVLSKSTTDQIRSKIKSPQLSELVFECYITPKEFAQIIEKYDGKEFEVDIKEKKR